MLFTDTHKSMYAFIREQMKNPEAEKIYYYGGRFSAEEVLKETDVVASYLQSIGIKKGDSVGICLPNIPQAIAVFYGVNKIGAIANVMHPKIGGQALKRIIEDTDTKVVFLLDRFYKKENVPDGVAVVLCRMSDKLKGIKKLFRLTEPPKKAGVSYLDSVKTAECNEYVADGDEPAIYIHSSGTTGKPKTVVLSSRALNELVISVYETVKDVAEITEKMSMLMILPIFHGFGLGICMHLTLCLGRIVMMPLFRAKGAVKLMKRETVNVVSGVPGMYRRLLAQKGFKGDFLKNFQMLFCGGDKLDMSLKKAFQARLEEYGCHTKIMEGYGLTEVTTVCTINTFDPDNGSMGRGIGGVKLKIMDGDRVCAPNETGEIYVSSPAAMSGYLHDVADCMITENGETWIKTGDAGYLDDDGCLYFRERIKRLVKIGGVNVFPLEIEESAMRYPKVKHACAVRITYENKPAVKLLVVRADGVDGDITAELKEHIKTDLSAYASPRVVEFVKEIKTNMIGKADYRYYEEKEGR